MMSVCTMPGERSCRGQEPAVQASPGTTGPGALLNSGAGARVGLYGAVSRYRAGRQPTCHRGLPAGGHRGLTGSNPQHAHSQMIVARCLLEAQGRRVFAADIWVYSGAHSRRRSCSGLHLPIRRCTTQSCRAVADHSLFREQSYRTLGRQDAGRRPTWARIGHDQAFRANLTARWRAAIHLVATTL
jgi:hypothetical protein